MKNLPDIQRADVNAILLTFAAEISLEQNRRVHHVAAELRANHSPESIRSNVLELVPAYNTLMIYYDFINIDEQAFIDALKQVLSSLSEPEAGAAQGELYQVGVLYDTSVGLDLECVARRVDASIDDVIAMHTKPEYHVYAIGFAPGFAYLGDVDQALRLPRLDSPRQKVPALSVAIAEQQTAIYPLESPGGWNILGRCAQLPPLAAGVRVQFYSLTRADYEQQRQAGDK
ncbi:sensor histidine kinase inhibitor, KipI family [Pseudidiomarina planktonica]|uniref:Sensor histidine kinase inhibitor, KipI family n=1 Tax=Pseudidiomarina planktonica TaxID=1323738 RepID=A0A1Y6EZY8_9GAMM|nr:allophanate hydrolase subunit 1 [Pseudidiomarina planktonica]RUO65188.1 allophanate hydrolase subunit 1 [Pseudidiomarina planktonica]SMQ66112.1 sensor histidine kinase inhibitor, KipI family [Pseudidiomarina planktonica]